VEDGDEIVITAETPVTADFYLYVNDILITEVSATNTFAHTYTVNASSGNGTIKLVAVSGVNSNANVFQYILSSPSPQVNRPARIIPGINYHSSDPTRATLCLWAPDKESVYAIGDFSDWKVLPEYLMKRSGEYFWIEISSLVSGQEYAFQYLIDESIYVADPYSDKILDPDDQYIPESVYPNLKDFPAEALKNDWYYNRLAVLQTGQEEYQWQVTDFEKPLKEKLVIYELLIRDFFGSNDRSYDNLIDTLSYLKRLGVNAIELMPIMEFNGNESWGYNPTFMFAPDKYYGDKNSFKRFVDECHKQNISVILDIALNHQDIPNPYLMMDFDFSAFKPHADNKWFNITATHPFSVFYDMNHESSYTKKYIDTVNYHWLNEYKVDGFRFDLSKGFTQTNNSDNVGAWSAYDASRIAILKRMADKIWEHTPDAIVILEHLAVNAEEKELAEYRAEEGKGMMLWGKMTEQYNQNTMGFAENSNITGVYHKSRGWEVPHLVSYMESHDEERLMYKNKAYGNKSGVYDVKELNVALARQRAASVLFYTVPGPKMLWQFGELGYDLSINHCEDGSNNSNCRVSPKPVRWDYRDDDQRNGLYKFTSELIGLRNSHDVFTKGEAVISGENTLVKQIQLKNMPYTESPALADDMNAVMVGNFDVVSRDVSVTFPHAGTWYDYYLDGGSVVVTGSSLSMNLAPGAYKLFTDVTIEPSVVTGSEDKLGRRSFQIFPNPVQRQFSVAGKETITELVLYSIQGVAVYPERISDNVWNSENIPGGLYIVEVKTKKEIARRKIIKR
jgi:1,4-alpha-glucan branching enzyme